MRERAASSVMARCGVATPAYPAMPPRFRPGQPLVRIGGAPLRAAGNRYPDRGTTPDSRVEGGPPAEQAGEVGSILVVDDDQAILETVSEILAMEGYPVVAVADGAEALRRIAQLRPSLVLLDMRMPGLNGWEVAHRMRADGITVPILVMTAAQDARLWAEQIDAAGYLAKPFDLDDLLTAVERLWPS